MSGQGGKCCAPGPIMQPIMRGIIQACSTCPAGSTVDGNGAVSRLHITACFCDTVVFPEEGDWWANVSLEVNGDTTSWAIDAVDDWDLDKCVTFTFTGGPLSYGDVIILHYDHSGPNPWPSMSGDVDISVTNLIGIPVFLNSPENALVDHAGNLLVDHAGNYLVWS